MCLLSRAKIFTLRLGTNSLVDADPNRVEFTVTHSVAHPDFNPGNLENDIGLIKIDSGVETTGSLNFNNDNFRLHIIFVRYRFHSNYSFSFHSSWWKRSTYSKWVGFHRRL